MTTPDDNMTTSDGSIGLQHLIKAPNASTGCRMTTPDDNPRGQLLDDNPQMIIWDKTPHDNPGLQPRMTSSDDNLR
jgi:hypothetical protein